MSLLENGVVGQSTKRSELLEAGKNSLGKDNYFLLLMICRSVIMYYLHFCFNYNSTYFTSLLYLNKLICTD